MIPSFWITCEEKGGFYHVGSKEHGSITPIPTGFLIKLPAVFWEGK
jgi:hypothetical protein